MRRDDRNIVCFDTLLLATPIVIGAVFYGSLVLAEVGLKSVRTMIWGKK